MKWVEIESKLEQAKAAESIARQQLSHSTLTAPFAGVIAAKNVDLGTYALPGQPVPETRQCGTSQRQDIRTRS